MSGLERTEPEAEPVTIQLPDLTTLNDEQRAMLLGCYRLLMEIAERRGIEVWPTTTEPEQPAPKPKRQLRPSTARLAKWEVAWAAEQASGEAES